MNLQEKTEVRTISMDGDSVEVTFRFDEQWQVWIGEHTLFMEEPRYTPSGRPWTNAVYDRCPITPVKILTTAAHAHISKSKSKRI